MSSLEEQTFQEAQNEPDPDLDIDTSVSLEVEPKSQNPCSVLSQDRQQKGENCVYFENSFPDQRNELLARLNKQRDKGQFLDLKLTCNGRTLPCHRCVLAASSPYFEKTLSKLGDSQQEFCLDDLKPFALEAILNFVYTSKIKFFEETAPNILSAASTLQYPVIVKQCCDFLQRAISARNCLGISLLAQEHACPELQESARLYALDHPNEVFTGDEFLELSVDQLAEYIASDSLNVTTEDKVFEAVMRWVGHDESNRGLQLERILEHVRLPLLSGRLFSESLESHPLITNRDKCRELVTEAKHLRDILLKGKEVHSRSAKPRPSTLSDVLVIVGGMETNRKWVKDVTLYDPVAKTWESLTALTFLQTDYSVASLNDDIYITGGFKEGNATFEVWCYKTAQDKWTEVANLKLARFNHSSTALDGMLYVVGGETDDSGLTEIEKYDPYNNTWEIIGDCNPTESNPAVTGLNHKLYIIGWLVHARLMCAVQCFDLKTKECMIQPCSGLNRQLFPIIAFQDAIYILGGSRIKEVAVYSPETYQSTKSEPMRYKRNTPSAAIVGGRLYVVGGELRHHLDKVEVYDPESKSWTMVAPMPTGLCFHGCVGVKKYLGPPYKDSVTQATGSLNEVNDGNDSDGCASAEITCLKI